MVQVSVILKVPFFSLGDKSRFFMTEDCNSNNTLLTQGVTTKQLHYITSTTTERILTRKI